MKKLIIAIFIALSCPLMFGQVSSKELTAADSVFNVTCLGEWLEIAVSDTGAADTVLVYYPITTITGTAGYALCGTIKEIATDENVVGLYGNADAKVYILWLPSPRSVRFVLSDYASGDVYISTVGK